MFVKFETNFSDGFEDDIVLRLCFSGCRKGASGHPCPGCHNPGLWDFSISVPGIYEELEKHIEETARDGAVYTMVSLIGGEPLDQPREEAEKVLSIIQKTALPIILYTGRDESEVFSETGECAGHPFAAAARYVKCGAYVKELAPDEREYAADSKPKLATANQSLYEAGYAPDGTRKIKKIK